MKKIFYIFFIALISSCSNEKGKEAEPTPDSGFPEPVANILVTKCATQGCHNSASRNSASGLDFSSWDKLFEGGRNGSSVVPYSTQNSFMLYAVNTDSNRGPVLLPTMPSLGQPLSN